MQSKETGKEKQRNHPILLTATYVTSPILLIIILCFARHDKTSWGMKAAVIGIAGTALWFFWDYTKSMKEKNRHQAIVSLIRAIILVCILFFAFLDRTLNFFSLQIAF